jgi:hypothetical protein
LSLFGRLFFLQCTVRQLLGAAAHAEHMCTFTRTDASVAADCASYQPRFHTVNIVLRVLFLSKTCTDPHEAWSCYARTLDLTVTNPPVQQAWRPIQCATTSWLQLFIGIWQSADQRAVSDPCFILLRSTALKRTRRHGTCLHLNQGCCSARKHPRGLKASPCSSGYWASRSAANSSSTPAACCACILHIGQAHCCTDAFI